MTLRRDLYDIPTVDERVGAVVFPQPAVFVAEDDDDAPRGDRLDDLAIKGSAEQFDRQQMVHT